MAKEYNQRYDFLDVVIYQKIGNRYFNITDYSPFKEYYTIEINSDSKYIVVYENFTVYKKSKMNENIQFSEITEQELMVFAGFEKKKSPTMQGKLKVIGESKYAAFICAEKIYGTKNTNKRIIIKDETAMIQRRKTVKEKQFYMTVLSLPIKQSKVRYIEK